MPQAAPDLRTLQKREDVARLCRYACTTDGLHPRVATHDRVIGAVTEGRSLSPGYFSCGDLPHWLLFRLGYRAAWINRREATGWKIGLNLTLLCSRPWGANPLASGLLASDPLPECGDVLVVGADAPALTHAAVVIDWYADTVVLAEFGQPGGAINRKSLERVRVRRVPGGDFECWKIGSRVVHSVLRLSALDHLLTAEPESIERWCIAWNLTPPPAPPSIEATSSHDMDLRDTMPPEAG